GFHTVTLVDPDLVALGVPADSPLGQGGRADDAVVPDGHHVREHSVASDEQALSAGAVLVTQLGAWVAVIAACVGQGVHPDRRTAITLPGLTPAVVAAPGPVRSSLLPAGGLPGPPRHPDLAVGPVVFAVGDDDLVVPGQLLGPGSADARRVGVDSLTGLRFRLLGRLRDWLWAGGGG